MKNNILITGATGFLGSLFLKNLNRKKNNIFCIGSSNKAISSEDNQYSLLELPQILDSLKGDIYALHLATYYSKEDNEKEKIRSALEFSSKFLQIVTNTNIKNFLYTNTMFQFDKDSQYYYTQTKNEFSKILHRTLSPNNISEIYLTNTFHVSDTREKVVPIILKSVMMRTGNPVIDKKSYINLVFAEDIIEAISTEIYNQCSSISRITSSVDVNISSIYDFFNSKNNISNYDNKKLKKIDSLYLKNTEIPPINEYYKETNIYNALATLRDF